MVQQTINVGTTANDGTGDALRTAFQKANSNDSELYAAVASNATAISGKADASATTAALSDKIDASAIDTDSTFAANSDSKVPSQKAVKTAFAAFTSGREILAANRTYYVRIDGSDSNNGLANTSAGAFRTIQRAVDATAILDIRTYNVTISVVSSDATTGGASVVGPWLGSGTVSLIGDTTTPANTPISGTGHMIVVDAGGRLTIGGLKISSSGGNGIYLLNGTLNITGKMEYGTCSASHITIGRLGQMNITANYTISGSAPIHQSVGGSLSCSSLTVTLTGTPAFSSAFAYATRGGVITSFSNVYSGGATGKRYLIDLGGVIATFGGGANYFPGDVTGTGGTTTGAGIYN